MWSQLTETDAVPLNVINNYFSVGMDASIALQFHHERQSHPEKFKSRARNKIFYAQLGARQVLHRSCANLDKHIHLIVDDQLQDITNVQAIIIINITRYACEIKSTRGALSKRRHEKNTTKEPTPEACLGCDC